ncbi:MAG: elongation factor P 5-aminopentanone reductase [Clostridium sp.]
MKKLMGKVAIVTGGSRGIGRAISLELCKAGASVVIGYEKNKEGAEETLRLINEIGGYGVLVSSDISTCEGAELLVGECIKNYGRVDILINNAGKSQIGLFMDTPPSEIKGLVETNLLSYMYMSKFTIPHMLQNGGNIINISSIWGEMGASCEVVYSSTKGGINTFTKALAKEMAGANIRVNGIAPGMINTSMNNSFSDKEREGIINDIPLMKIGEGEDVALAAVFLASEDSKYITGEILRVDGGFGR